MNRRPTLKDVAKAAGISPTQASMALNGTGRVGKDTIERVRAAAEELCYRPDRTARALRVGQGDALGLVVRNLSNSYFLDVIRGMDDVCAEADCSLLIMDSDYDYQREAAAVERMSRYRVFGLALAPIGGTSVIEWWQQHGGHPLVLLNTAPQKDWICVGPDGPQAIQHALGEFRRLGHRRVALVGAKAKMQADTDRRTRFAELCDDWGIEGVQLESRLSFDAIYERIGRCLDDPAGPRAFLMNSDYTASAVYAAARARGLEIGRDVSVVGHDGIPTGQLFDPPLTTVQVDSRAVGRAAARALLDLADGKEATSQAIPTALLQGSSVARTEP